MGSAVGEEVSADVVNYYRNLEPDVLMRIRSSGISDQRVALIDRILYERTQNISTPTRELVSDYAEPRTVAEVRYLKEQQRLKLEEQEQQRQEQRIRSIQQNIAETQKEPLGKPNAEVKLPWYKRGYYYVADTISGTTGGVWLEHFARPTSRSAEGIKEEFKESTITGIKNIKYTDILRVPYGIPKIQTQWIQSAKELRKEGLETQAEQKQNIQDIESSVSKITEAQEKLSESGYYKQAEQFEKDVTKLESDIEKFNISYEGKPLPERDFEKALETKKELESRKQALEVVQKSLETKYTDYEKTLTSEIKTLRKSGVSTELKEGDIKFTSKALETKVSPVGLKLQASFKKDGRITWKNIAYGGGAIAHTTAEFVGIGYATGGTGVIAKVGAGVAKLPKGVQTALKVGTGAVAIAGIGAKTYKGYQLGKVEGVEKIGAVVGGLSATGQIVGFGYGAYKGTQFYYKGIERKILSGKYTKSTLELKRGYLLESKTQKGALTKQTGIYETKIAGTKYKIETYAKITGKYAGKTGKSNVELVSKFIGKAPKGYPKTFVTKGGTLESDSLIRARLYTKGAQNKIWYEQDVLLKRVVLSQKPISIKGAKFYPYNKLQELKFITDARIIGKPIKVGKTIPKNIWTSGESYLFRVSKGAQKVAGVGEFADLKTDSLFSTRQYVLYTPTKQVGNIQAQKFSSIAQTKGASADLLKKALSDKLVVLTMDKRASLALGAPKQIFKTDFKITDISPAKLTINPKSLLKIQLSKIVPNIIAKESLAVSSATVPLSIGSVGLKNILDVRVKRVQVPRLKNLSALKLQMQTKVAEIQVQTPKIVQSLSIRTTTPQIQTPSITSPIITSPFVSPSIPTVPIIPVLDIPDFRGYMRKQTRQNIKAGRQRPTYVEGFTAKAIDIKPIEIDIKQAERLLKKELTGLELRRGVIVR